MNRRRFLSLLGGSLGAAAVAPKTYFLPPPGGWLRTSGGLYAANSAPLLWVTKTPEEILADMQKYYYPELIAIGGTLDRIALLSDISRKRTPNLETDASLRERILEARFV